MTHQSIRAAVKKEFPNLAFRVRREWVKDGVTIYSVGPTSHKQTCWTPGTMSRLSRFLRGGMERVVLADY